MTHPSRDWSRFPRWARNERDRLAQRVNELEAELRQRDTAVYSTNTCMMRYGEEHDQPLPNGATIGFTLNMNDTRRDAQITVRVTDDGELKLNGYRGIAVYPRATNDVSIRIID